jgi:ATP-dependent protease HslVU (ClpYQ) peptidase subunit
MEDVQDAMAQQDELDKLDRKDPLYKEKAGEIRSRYKSIATERQSGRESEDLQARMQLEGDKIKGFRSSEVANRSAAENAWSEYSRQQKQISGLESPVMKTRDVMRAVGTGRVIKVGEEQYEDAAATKQNQATAEELRKKLPELEKKAREYVALADEAGNQAVHAANMASTISTARSVSLAKAGVMTQGAASERADAYASTDAAQEALNKQLEEKRKKDEEEIYLKKAAPVIEQSQAELEAAKKRAADARLSEQQAVLVRDNADTTFHASGSRNVLKHESSMAPLQAGASQATAAREKAERDVANLERALKDLMDAYGSGFNKMAQEVKRNTINQRLDATGN